jgi:hypothetical protein
MNFKIDDIVYIDLTLVKTLKKNFNKKMYSIFSTMNKDYKKFKMIISDISIDAGDIIIKPYSENSKKLFDLGRWENIVINKRHIEILKKIDIKNRINILKNFLEKEKI